MKKLGIALMLILACALAFTSVRSVWAYPVPQLPEDNLLINPWFRSSTDPNTAGLDGWTNILTDGVGWGLSQKDSNPSPDLLDCEDEAGYCGTGARWARMVLDRESYTYPGLDVYLYQVVETDPAHRRLQFSMYWVNHRIEVTEVLVYGSSGPEGPWTEVWLPITISQDENPKACCQPGHNGNPWLHTGILDTTLESGFAYYRLVLHARYPEVEANQGEVGVKITGLYFSTSLTPDETSLSTPVVVYNPSAAPDGSATLEPTREGRPTEAGPTATLTGPPATSTATSPPPTSTPWETPPPTATPGATDPPPTSPARSTPTPGPTPTPRERP